MERKKGRVKWCETASERERERERGRVLRTFERVYGAYPFGRKEERKEERKREASLSR